MKQLLTTALIAIALASPVRGEKIFANDAELVLAEGEVLSATAHVLDADQGTVIYYVLLRHRDVATGRYAIYNCEYVFFRGRTARSHV
jgi:hypothetical protein